MNGHMYYLLENTNPSSEPNLFTEWLWLMMQRERSAERQVGKGIYTVYVGKCEGMIGGSVLKEGDELKVMGEEKEIFGEKKENEAARTDNYV